jgi:hypothetical protein
LALRSLSGVRVTIPTQQGLSYQVQASFDAAATFATRFILYAEGDKEDFFVQRLEKFLTLAPTHPDVGVVLASRSLDALATLPQCSATRRAY